MDTKKCPNCGRVYSGYPVLSRKDNKTEICPTCGIAEALEGLLIFSCLLKGVKKW